MRDLKKLEEVVRSLFRIEPRVDGLAALSAGQATLQRLPEEYYEAANSLAQRAQEGTGRKVVPLVRTWA